MNTKKNILVTGANGQLGQELARIAPMYSAYQFVFASKNKLDVTHKKEVKTFFKYNPIDYIIHTAAYTKVDLAEQEIKRCNDVNVQGTANLVDAIKGSEIVLIHLSSDYVYHNDCKRPLVETDPCTPKSIYALSKLISEYRALKHPKTFVIRTSWVYGIYGHNFLKTMKRLMAERTELSIVDDQIGQPTHTLDLAKAIMNFILYSEKENNKHRDFGIYNYSNLGPCSWYEFALQISRALGHHHLTINPIPSTDYPTPAIRPPYSVLDCSKYQNLMGQQLIPWKIALQTCIQNLIG